MGAILDRVRAQLAGLVPISFDAPDPEARCPGKDRISKPQLFGLCHTCARLGGHDIEPAARMAQGLAVCLNYRQAA